MTTADTDQFQPASFLVVDCGSNQTRALLFDVVSERYRLIGRAAAHTTIRTPWSDLTHGIVAAIEQLSESIGRPLLSSMKRVLTPAKNDRSGVDRFLMVLSAAPPLKTVLVGLSEDVSLASARRVLHTVYAQEVDTFSLADNRSEEEQVQAIIRHEPDLIFLVGGTNGGADQRLVSFAQTVSLGLSMLAEAKRVPVLYAGNVEQRAQVREIMGDGITLHVANNVRPALGVEDLIEAAQIIGGLYESLRINELPGLHKINQWTDTPPVPTARAFATITQYFAALYQGQVLGIELGTESVTLIAASEDQTDLTIRADLGMGRTITNILSHVKPAAIANWIPAEISDEEIRDYIYNKSLHAQTLAASEKELLIEQAITRELLRCAAEGTVLDWQNSDTPHIPFRLLLVRGKSVVNAPRPGQIISIILDALQPMGIFSIVMDQYGVLPALGALAMEQPLAAVQVLESQILTNLGWVVVPTGKGKPGQKVLHVQIESEHQTRYEGDVEYGTLELFVLEEGKSKVTLSPSRQFDIGFGPGKGETITISGGAVGLVVDARGRPFTLPQDEAMRRSVVQQWHYDMGG